jgi:hypothetical protein
MERTSRIDEPSRQRFPIDRAEPCLGHKTALRVLTFAWCHGILRGKQRCTLSRGTAE